jgi:hypothetical protein
MATATVARRLKPALYAALFLGAGCAWPSPERQLLLDFFQACRVYDTTVLARLGTAPCNPQADGVVQDFEMINVDDAGAGAKVVTIDAQVRPLGGSPAPRRLTVRLEQLDGRWMVAGVTPLPASQTSPAASSAPPK